MLKIKNREEIKSIISEIDSPIICEVGVRFGDHLSYLLTSNVKLAYGVDIWKNTENVGQNDSLYSQEELDLQYSNVLERFKNDKRVKIIRDFSVSTSKTFEDEYFDFVYLDADHTYNSVMDDLESWWPKVKVGGILSGHDYIDGDTTIRLGHSVRFGVVEAVRDFRIKYSIPDEKFYVTEELYGNFFIIK
jgi:cephalosporin hydroxylase